MLATIYFSVVALITIVCAIISGRTEEDWMDAIFNTIGNCILAFAWPAIFLVLAAILIFSIPIGIGRLFKKKSNV